MLGHMLHRINVGNNSKPQHGLILPSCNQDLQECKEDPWLVFRSWIKEQLKKLRQTSKTYSFSFPMIGFAIERRDENHLTIRMSRDLHLYKNIYLRYLSTRIWNVFWFKIVRHFRHCFISYQFCFLVLTLQSLQFLWPLECLKIIYHSENQRQQKFIF
jgi:hypothetical protein